MIRHQSPFFFLVLLAFIHPVFAQQPSMKEEQDYTFALGLFKDRNYQLAFDQFSQFVRNHPASNVAMDAEYYVAESLFQLGSLTDAALSFRAFQEKYSRSKLADDAGFREGEIYYRQSHFDKAFSQFASVLKNFPDGDLAHESAYWAGESAFRNEDYKSAIRYYQIAYEHYPEGQIRDYAFFSVGYVLEKTGQFDEAVKTYEKFLSDFSGSSLRPTVLTRIAACKYQQRDYAAAISWLDGLSDSPDPENAAERLFLNAEAHYQLERYAAAEQLYRKYIAAYPQFPRARQVKYSLGWTFIEQKKYTEAIATFDELINGNDPISEAALFRKGMSLRLNGNLEPARRVFLDMINNNPTGEYTDNARFELGMAAYDAGNFKEALSYFSAVTTKHPKSDVLADSYSMQGETYLKLNQPTDAATAFASAMNTPDILPKVRSNSHFRYGYSLFEASKFHEAARTFEEFVKTFPNDLRKPDALIWLGESYLKLDNPSEAVIVYNQSIAVTKDPFLLHDAFYGLGWCYLRLQRFQDAIQTFKKLTTEYKGGKYDIDATIRMGDAQYAMKHFPEAIKTYRFASRMYPNHKLAPYALLQLGNAEHRAGDTPSGISTLKALLAKYPASEYADKAQFSLGWLFFQIKDYPIAISEFQKVLDKYSGSPIIANTKYTIGDCYYNLGKYSDAEKAYRRIINEHPDSPLVSDALDGISQCLRMQGKNAEASAVRHEWLKSNPTSKMADEVAFGQAKKQLIEKNMDMALASLQNFIATFPSSPRYQEALLLIGQVFGETGKYEEARNTLREAISKNPSSSIAIDSRLQLAQIAIDGQDWNEALNVYGQLLADPNAAQRKAEILYLRGMSFRRNRQFEHAKQDFEQAKKEGTGFDYIDLASIELARLKAQNGDISEATTELTDIATSRTDDIGAQAQYLIGDILYDANRFEESEKALLRVEYVYSESINWISKAFLLLGKIYEEHNENSKALNLYKKVLEKYSGTPESNEARNRLERLK